ncbi:CAP domain-containing protein [Streptomyces sp. NPDC006733]|uniref:CAP domain-containing protein n=1 Tax=Streptomyces sp. NPDC006733 TaxID=3155460 RepID=UPI0033C74974
MNREPQPSISTPSAPEPGANGAPYPQRPDGRGAHSAARGRSAGRHGGRHGGRGGQHRGRRSRWAVTVGGAAALIAVAGGGYTVVRSVTEPADQTRSAAGPAPVTGVRGTPGTPGGASAAPHSTAPATPSRSASVTAAPSSPRPGTRPATTAPHTTGTATGATGTAGADKGAGARKAPSSGTLSGGTTARYAQQVVDMVNSERARKGCKPVTVNAALQAAAQAHSDDMAARDYYEHNTPEGVGPGARMTSAGYHWSTWGENIYKSPQDARTAMDGWMKSPGHRDNILNCAFKEIGVGINLASNGPWWTQDFGAAS